MRNIFDSLIDGLDSFFAYLSSSLKTTTESYCEVDTAEPKALVAHDGSLISVIRISGTTTLIGEAEFARLHEGLSLTLQTTMSRPGYAIQVLFNYDKENVGSLLQNILEPAANTAKRLRLSLNDLFNERTKYLSQYCAEENVYFVLWTRTSSLTKEQFQRATKEKAKLIRENKIPPFKLTQNVIAPMPDLRDPHEAFVRSVMGDLATLNVSATLLDAHEAVYEMRRIADPEFTAREWKAVLPGDKIRLKEYKAATGELSDLLWPSLARQILPRDAENLDLRTVRIGDKVYSSVFIDLFPKDIRAFIALFQRTLATRIPWRISFFIESAAVSTVKLKGILASILSFSSAQNRLLADAVKLLKYIDINTDDAVVRLRVAAVTWAPYDNIPLLRTRASELAKAIEGWGSCDISEVSGDPFGGVVSSFLAFTSQSVATPAVAPLSDVIYMLPITRPASPWKTGAMLYRTPDGKPWPYQPGSGEQTTWIDLMYARPGSGKSVLSNTLNLALCLSPGIQRLPHIAIIDIGPSSSGLISLLKEALPAQQRHLVAYHRLRMTPDYSINPFDTQLGCRFPTPQERSFLVNFITLLATPLGAQRAYDGIADMAGLIVDELYKNLADGANPYTYTPGVDLLVDGLLEEIGFVRDQHTTWWEVTDALFIAGFHHEALLAQRYAVPLLADGASIARTPAVEDLYGKIIAPTGEPLINAFSRMISSAVREYPILSRVTNFDIGDSRVVSLDLDEVAKIGGDAADRQTAVMYMIARYALARHYYLTEENVRDMPTAYQDFHRTRIAELREDPKRIVYDEFHRTSKAEAVRNQVIVDMREGRKWGVQIGLISQSIDDFDEVMVEFATSIYIMDAGPAQTVQKTAKIFGLSQTGIYALRTRVHGPREGGATFLALFATKAGLNTQLLTNTIGPIELWAFSTTVADVNVRNQLYKRIGPLETRRVLGSIFPSGSVSSVLEKRLAALKEEYGVITDEDNTSVVDKLVEDILVEYKKDPHFKSLPS